MNTDRYKKGMVRGARCALLVALLFAGPLSPARAQSPDDGFNPVGNGSVSALATQTDIAGPAGSGFFGVSVTVLPNGNFVVTDPSYSIPSGAANVGAVYLYNGATRALISTLTGSTAYDVVGNGGVTALTNGNYVVSSYYWQNGAVTWCNGTTGCTGAVTSANSLVGSTAGDFVGREGVTALTNGNYVVSSYYWDNGATADVGAMTWCNGTTGCTGAVSSANSLVGSTVNDQVGSDGVTALTNGNYVVRSSNWDNGATANVGAATWCNGTTGCTGAVTSSNSLVGSTANDNVGSHGVTALTNGNYVVRSLYWANGAATWAGAVTWCNGTTGCAGAVTSSNSLVGSTVNDVVGYGVTALANGNYVVGNRFWDNGATANVGAVTWCNGTAGCTGAVTPANSLVGSTAYDQVGSCDDNYCVMALTNGNYVVSSQYWNNGATIDVGAVTWCNGTTGCTGAVTSSNSLFGSTANDQVGTYFGSDGVTALTNGNYVVISRYWDVSNAEIDLGAATWCNGTTGCTGAVTHSNSLIGSTVDYVEYGVTALTNGNYVVSRANWANGAATRVGAVTWCNGTTGCTGAVTSANSLVGSTANDYVGSHGVTALTNGNYVVSSAGWANGAATLVGAVTWCNGTTGCAGAVTSSNSLVGSTVNDWVGSISADGVTALTNGNYVVSSYYWDNGATADAGAVTWCNGTAGCAGAVTSANSLVGSTANDNVGGVTVLTNGNYVVSSPNWDNSATINAGAVTLGAGNTGTTVGAITAANSVRGTVASGGVNLVSAYDTVNKQLVVGRPNSNLVSVFDCSFCNTNTTTTTIASHNPNPSVVGQAVIVNYTVTSASGTPTGNVTVSDGTVNCTGTVAAGACNLTFTSAGTKMLTATYAGDVNFDGSTSAAVAQIVNNPVPSGFKLFLPLILR